MTAPRVTLAQLAAYHAAAEHDAQAAVSEAIVELANVEANGTLHLRQAAAERVEELRARVRQLAAQRVLARRQGPQTVTLPTPYGSLVHAVSLAFVRPATARDKGDLEVARRNGRPCLHIAHTHAGETWEEPYTILPTKTITMRVDP